MSDPLVFGPPERGQHVGTPSPIPKPNLPSPSRQGARLSPQFATLRVAIENRRAELVSENIDVDPELVAVFDIAGTVEKFYRAVRLISGLEFLAEFEDEELPPDEDFYFQDDEEVSDTPIAHSLYLLATNAEAIDQLISLWDHWVQDPTMKFARGLGPLRDLFAQLRAIRRWGPQDRLRDSGLLEDWRDRIAVSPDQPVPVEAELWFRQDASNQQAAEEAARRAIEDAGGQVLSSAVLPEISYHGVLAELPRTAAQSLVDGDVSSLRLLVTEDVMFVRPASRASTDIAVEVQDQDVAYDQALPQKPPRVALLDGFPLAAHAALTGRLVIDDPDELEGSYPTAARQHGTAMASIIVHGDLSAPGHALPTRLHVQPVLTANLSPFGSREIAPPGRLFVDVLHRAIRRLFVDETGDSAKSGTAPTVKVINLSIGDVARHFVRELSPLARLLDWAAHHFNVLIVVSAGNQNERLALPYPSEAELIGADPKERQAHAVRHLYHTSSLRRLLSPAESVNALTIGASSADVSDPSAAAGTLVDVFPTTDLPAPYSARGLGYRRAVKPEALYPGGRVYYLRPVPGSPAPTIDLLPWHGGALPPGTLSAIPGPQGSLRSVGYDRGTSQAAAMASRCAGFACEVLERLRAEDPDNPGLAEDNWPALLKALLVHAARWGSARAVMEDALGLDRVGLTRVLGYGAVAPEDVATSGPHRAVLLGGGRLRDREQDTFRLPLPPSLRATTEWRRLTATLAWISPIAPQARKRRVGRLWFEPPTDQAGVDRREADYRAVRRGTVQHEVLEGTAALAFADGDTLAIVVNCRIDHAPPSTVIAYGLAVSIELGTHLLVDVHSEIEERLRARVVARVQVGS